MLTLEIIRKKLQIYNKIKNRPNSFSKYSSGSSVTPTLGSISIANKFLKPLTFVGTLLNF